MHGDDLALSSSRLIVLNKHFEGVVSSNQR